MVSLGRDNHSKLAIPRTRIAETIENGLDMGHLLLVH